MTISQEQTKKIIEDTEYLPTGMEIKPNPELTISNAGGTFWDYCSDTFINFIGIGLALASLAIGYGLWKFVWANNFIIR
jgi:hypothetical protein